MEIKDFSFGLVRIGRFPNCVDVKSVPDYHSDDGIICNFETYIPKNNPRRIVVVKDYNTLTVFMLKWSDQFDNLPEEYKEGEILYDSSEEKPTEAKTPIDIAKDTIKGVMRCTKGRHPARWDLEAINEIHLSRTSRKDRDVPGMLVCDQRQHG